MMRTGLALLLALGAFGILGCGDDDGDPPRDSGPGDTGPGTDARPPDDDAGPPDEDAGPTDAGPECTRTEDCPAPASECQTAFCGGGMCQTMNLPSGTLAAAQTAGDCQANVCDGDGNITSQADDADIADDMNDCTADVCSGGTPMHTPLTAGTACGAAGDLVCDGAGMCVGCTMPSDCEGTDTECATITCVAGMCGVAFTAAGTRTAMQTPGDCFVNQCDGTGTIELAADTTDLPDDMNDCTDDVCTPGPMNPPRAAGTACGGPGSTSMCNGAGVCVGCVMPSDCAGSDTECGVRTCTAGVCGRMDIAAGTPTTMQTAGDCQRRECDGSGAVRSIPDDLDLPVDTNACTNDLCTAGVPSNPNSAAGSACIGGGCDGSGMCTQAAFAVVRVGDGTSALVASAAEEVFIELRTADGTVVRTIPLPTAMMGTNRPFGLSGSATSDGLLSRSADGRYLTLAGYLVPPGTAGVSAGISLSTCDPTMMSCVPRGVARIDALGNVDTSTVLLDAFNTDNVRSATSVDGTAFWVSGNSGSTPMQTGGAHHVLFGSTGATTRILATPNNTRALRIYDGQLWGSASTSTFRLFTIGMGTPTTTGQTTTTPPGLPTGTTSPYQFVLFDRSATVAGLDTLYVADDRSSATGGGIQKWTFDGTMWTLATTLTEGTVGFRGLDGEVIGGNVVLYAVSAEGGPPNRIVRFVDDGATTPMVIATSPTNMWFKGLALVPR